MQKLSISIVSCFCMMMITQKCIAQNNSLKGLLPGAITFTAKGCAMSAKINGKDCKAFAVMPADKTGEIVVFYTGDKYIGLPYHKRDFITGKKFDFSKESADLTTADDVGVWGGRKARWK